MTKKETELWKQPPDPILEAVAKLVTVELPVWNGTASGLLQLLPELDMQPNVLTRKLNISMERLLLEYNIKYVSSRGHNGRMIKLELIKA